MNHRIVILLWLAWLVAPFTARSEDYAVDWFSVDGGGDTSADDVYEVSGTVGQPDAGELSDDVYAVSGGFWAATIEVEPPRAPVLKVELVGGNLVLSWPVTPGFFLEQSLDLSQPDGWHPVSQPIVVINGQNTVTVPLAGQPAFYRLTDTPSPTVPRLNIARSGVKAILSWPAWAAGYYLEANLSPVQANVWTHVGLPVAAVGDRNIVTLPMTGSHVFFRLTRTPNLPSLRISLVGANFVITWPAPAAGYYLEKNLDVAQPNGWSLSERPVLVINGQNTVTVPVGEMAYYRLTTTPSSLRLSIARMGTDVVLSWPASAQGYFLEATDDVSRRSGWSLVNSPIEMLNGLSVVTTPAWETMRFFRLTRTPGPPPLQITLVGTNAVLLWPEVYAGYFLEQNPDATRPGDWSYVGLPMVTGNRQNTVTLPLSAGMMFFRLTQTPHGPALRITMTDTNRAILSWSVNSTGFVLQQNSLPGTAAWQNVGATPELVGDRKQFRVPAAGAGVLFRLKHE